MTQITTLIYDGSFDGWLTSVFHAYEYKLSDLTIAKEHNSQNGLFGRTEKIYTDPSKAARVWDGLQQIGRRSSQNLFKTYLSEREGVDDLMFSFTRKLFAFRRDISTDFGDPDVMKISQINKKVDRESHRMKAFVRFQQTEEGLYVATIEPDFNVLPLIAKHFKRRYADQRWLIYDVRRHYGIHYDLKTVDNVFFEGGFNANLKSLFTESEHHFQDLWRDYFTSTGIKERKNSKLHQQHVPKRYWKYLSEKRPTIM